MVSVLFLDIEGAFPNVNPERLVHNLRKCKVPDKYTNFVRGMLDGRATVLKFNGYASEKTTIDNGIGQGDPLSMVLYQYYNANLLSILEQEGEEAVAYVDDAFMLATGDDFQDAHKKLEDMMCKERGVENWSKTHSSPLEYSKLALINFAHSQNTAESLALQLPHKLIEPSESTKYLGVIINRNLTWKAQQSYAVEKGTKWVAQIRRLTRPSWGITPKYAKRLFISVALPRVLYAVDVWCSPSDSAQKGPMAVSSVKTSNQITSVQRAGTLAITGGLRTSPMDALDACAFLLLAPLLMAKWCQRVYIRMATLPPEHPLFKPINWKRTRKTKRHRGPMQNLALAFEIDLGEFEKIPAVARDPSKTGEWPFNISIATNKENSAWEAENAAEEIQVFSDRSCRDSLLYGKQRATTMALR